jgi:hypothetical protein
MLNWVYITVCQHSKKIEKHLTSANAEYFSKNALVTNWFCISHILTSLVRSSRHTLGISLAYISRSKWLWGIPSTCGAEKNRGRVRYGRQVEDILIIKIIYSPTWNPSRHLSLILIILARDTYKCTSLLHMQYLPILTHSLCQRNGNPSSKDGGRANSWNVV